MKSFNPFFRIGLLATLILMIGPAFMKPENRTYDELWKEVDAFMEKGLPRSALELIEVVHQKALAENNGRQMLKSTIYRFNANQHFEEDHLIRAIEYAQEQLSLLQEPEKQLLLSVQAELYLFYYQQNRYRLLERTAISGQRPSDIREWDLTTLRDVITETYERSIENIDILLNYRLEDYASLLILPDKESVELQPTLFDFLAHRVIDHYLSADAGIKRPGPVIPLADKQVFAPAPAFTKSDLPENGQDVVKAMKLLQALLEFHLSHNDTTALIYNEIKRMELAHLHYQGDDDKGQLYEQALKKLLDQYQHHPASADVAFALASFLMSSDVTNIYNDEDAATRFQLKEALELCEQTIERHPDSKGAANCKVLKSQILRKELTVTVQRVYVPNQPIPALLKYRNVSNPSFRLVSMESEDLEHIMGIINIDEKKDAMLALEAFSSWEYELPFEEDYRDHSLVFDLPPLEPGLYLLLSSSGPAFADDDIIEYASFQVSSLSFISSKREGINHFYLLDRETGEPVRNARIRVMSREYDYTKRRYSVEQRMELSTARDGGFSFGADDNLPSNRAFYVEAETKNDRLYSDNYFDVYKQRQITRAHRRTWFFTDRAIYRPGQPVYFKGIMLDRINDEYKIVADQKNTIKFYDANGQEIASLELRTNEFGSFEGSFITPQVALTGEMRIADSHGSVFISVEEYKRPTFEVKVNMPTGQYRINDLIEINGEAVAYAGYPMDSVGLVYKVYREPFFPWRSYWAGLPPFGGERQLIASGETMTHRDGSFNFDFLAAADHNIDHRFEAAFSYNVLVDVTDRNGETRSGSQTIRAGKRALILNTDLPESIVNTQLTDVVIKATNLQQEAVSSDVNVSVYRIEKARRLVRPSLWPLPDRHLLDKAHFEMLFPLDAWDDAENRAHRNRELVFSKDLHVKGESRFMPSEATLWPDGEYLIIAKAMDSFGEEVELSQAFTLFNRQTKSMPVKELQWFNLSKTEAKPGETIYFSFGTAARNTRLLLEVFQDDKLIQSRWIRLTNEMSSLTFEVEEAHRGMLRFQATAVRYNRILSHSALVKVPHSDKILDIELITKREKLKPGAEETWELRISGHNKEAVVAELLASMYDASLDQFRPNNWYFNLISYPSPPRAWNADNGFLTYRSTGAKRQTQYDRSIMFVRPPQLNWFGFYGGYGGFPQTRHGVHASMMKESAMPESVDEIMLLEVLDDDAAVGDEETKPDTQAGTEPGEGVTQAKRTNFNETAFFYPQLLTSADGSVSITFTLPDALTRWRLMLLAHTNDLKTGMQEYNFVASKELMIVPNTTRFYREGDTAWVAARIVNTGEQTLTGIAWLELFDAFSGEELQKIVGNLYQKPFVNLEAGRSQTVRWKIEPGDETNLMGMRFSASANGFTDSEEQYVPILPRKVLVTETMPLYVPGEQRSEFIIRSLVDHPDRKYRMMQLDFSSNPVWYAIQALPYLHDDGAEHVHSLFNRYYANTLASHIANSIPGVMQVIDSWKAHHPDAFLSALETNQELKAVLLNETPWVMQARNESDRKRNIALLFDVNRMRYEQQHTLSRLSAQQLPNGAWPWFRGMRENRFITQTIVTGLGRLQKLGLNFETDHQIQNMVTKAMGFLDKEVMNDYEKTKRDNKGEPASISPTHLNYLYARSFFPDNKPGVELLDAINYYLEAIEANWLKMNTGMQGMAVVVLNRYNRFETANAIMASLRERAIHLKEMGTYWRQSPGYFWYQTPVETQVWLIEAFAEMESDHAEIDGLRTWLLSQKRTTHWNTGRATADAIYALLMQGTDWTSTRPADIMVGGKRLVSEDVQAGTGYYSYQWQANDLKTEMAHIDITNPNKGAAWGGVYLQYFEGIDKIEGHDSPLKVQKEMFVKEIKDNKEILAPLEGQMIEIGDEVVVRVLIETDRDMEFVHLKDERAAAFEPVDVLSGYNWRDGLGFYQSSKDASTEFFFAHLPKGKYVFEYSLRAMHAGDYASGRAQIQCLYAPEFAAHSSGNRIIVTD